MAKRPDFTPDRPLRADQLEELRQMFAKLSPDGLAAAYNAAWQRCKLERNGHAPRAEHVQELVQAWKQAKMAEGAGQCCWLCAAIAPNNTLVCPQW